VIRFAPSESGRRSFRAAGSLRLVTVVVSLLLARPASADVDLGLLGGWSAAGPAGSLEALYSPQGFLAVGAGLEVVEDSVGASLKLRAGLDVLRTVPRLQLSLGYGGQSMIWGADLGVDRFLTRRVALRAAGGWGSMSGWRAAGGLAWFPFD